MKNTISLISLTILSSLSLICSQQTDYLKEQILQNVDSSISSTMPSTESTLVYGYRSNIGYNQRDHLTADDLDEYIESCQFNADLEAIAKQKLDAVKYAEQEIVLLQNVTFNPADLDYSRTFLFIAASNVNSSISVSFYYGTVEAICIQQTYWVDCCDDTCSVGACRTVIHWGCSGCDQDRSFTAQELYTIGTCTDVTMRAAVLGDVEVSLYEPQQPEIDVSVHFEDLVPEVKEPLITDFPKIDLEKIPKSDTSLRGSQEDIVDDSDETEDAWTVPELENLPDEYSHFSGGNVITNSRRYSGYPKEWFGQDYNPPNWTEVADGILQESARLKKNISDMGHPKVSDACAVNTCLKFDHYQNFVDVARVECVKFEYIDQFVNTSFEDMFHATNDPDALREDLSQFKYSKDISWAMNNFDYSSTVVTKPGYSKVWKTYDSDSKCYHWLIATVYGELKIAPDIFKEDVTEKHLFGLISDSYTKYYYAPHVVTPEDVLALDNFFESILLNSECILMGINGTITYFPDLDC